MFFEPRIVTTVQRLLCVLFFEVGFDRSLAARTSYQSPMSTPQGQAVSFARSAGQSCTATLRNQREVYVSSSGFDIQESGHSTIAESRDASSLSAWLLLCVHSLYENRALE
jgi:hypothetical protein